MHAFRIDTGERAILVRRQVRQTIVDGGDQRVLAGAVLRQFEWRGLGSIDHSGVRIRAEYAALDAETERFRHHAIAHARTAHRWGPSWRLWVSKAHPPKAAAAAGAAPGKGEPPRTVDHDSAEQWRARLWSYKPGKFWLEGDWGPRPESGRSRVPAEVLGEWRERVAPLGAAAT